MNMNQMAQYKQYQNETLGVEFASPHQLVTKLYQSAIARLEEAGDYLDGSQPSKKLELTNKAINIIYYLDSVLEPEPDRELYEQYTGLYQYIIRQIREAQSENDAEKLEAAIDLIDSMAETWEMIDSPVAIETAGEAG